MIPTQSQWTNLKTSIYAFIRDRKAGDACEGTQYFYQTKLDLLSRWCEDHGIDDVLELTPDALRSYFVDLSEHHNRGGVHAAFRALRAFLYWWEREYEPENWRNPLWKIRKPKHPEDILEPVEFETVQALLKTCRGKTIYDDRDRAIFITLLDTGCRANELLMLNVADVDPVAGEVVIRFGKGRKTRTVYPGHTWRRVMRIYLRRRNPAPDEPLWLNRFGLRLEYDGLRSILRARSKAAHIKAPTPHMFRRAFALNFLRNDGDVFTLARLVGHSDIGVLKQYLKLTEDDLRASHHKASPVDHMRL